MIEADFLVVGGGIAGAGVAYELSQRGSVIVLEREPQPGYHSTGRSAALFSEIYGNGVIRALSRGSREFFLTPPPGFAAEPLLRPRGVLYIATGELQETFEELRSSPDVAGATEVLSSEAALARVPILRPEWTAHVMLEPQAHDVEVHALHQGFLRGLKDRGGRVACNSTVQSIERSGDSWTVFAGETYRAPVVVNAAGAWADEIASLAGLSPIGVQPCRRTALIVDAPPQLAVDAWPMIMDAAETFYMKPETGRLLMSPADETPCPPCDAQAEEIDVAIAVDRVEHATTLVVRQVRHRWAGLRCFASDRSPVVGFDPRAPGFFWLAGQGGYGIQTAPALSRLATALACELPVPADLQDLGIHAAALSPARYPI